MTIIMITVQYDIPLRTGHTFQLGPKLEINKWTICVLRKGHLNMKILLNQTSWEQNTHQSTQLNKHPQLNCSSHAKILFPIMPTIKCIHVCTLQQIDGILFFFLNKGILTTVDTHTHTHTHTLTHTHWLTHTHTHTHTNTHTCTHTHTHRDSHTHMHTHTH